MSVFSKKSKSDLNEGLKQRFRDIKKDSVTRIKHLRSILDNCTSEEEKKTFLTENAASTFYVFHDVFLQAESSLQNRATRTGTDEMQLALKMFEIILYYLPEMLSNHWQYYCIMGILKRLLNPSNTAGIMSYGLKYFVIWYQIVGIGPYSNDELDIIFSALIPNWLSTIPTVTLEHLCARTFYNKDDAINYDIQEVGMIKSPKLCPIYMRNLTVSNKESDDKNIAHLVETIFIHIFREFSKIFWTPLDIKEMLHEKCFRFLLDKIREFYLPRLMPNVSSFDLWNLPLQEEKLINFYGKLGLNNEHNNSVRLIVFDCLLRWIVKYVYSHRRLIESLERTQTLSNQQPQNVSRHSRHSALSFALSNSSIGASNREAVENTPTFNAASQFNLHNRLSDENPLKSGSNYSERLPWNYDLVRNVLFGSRTYVNFVFSIMREAMLMEPKHIGLSLHTLRSIEKVVRVWREWILLLDPPPFALEPSPDDSSSQIRAGLQSTLQAVICMSSVFFFNQSLFTLNSETEKSETIKRSELAKRVLSLYRLMVNEVYMSNETWIYLIISLKVIADQSLKHVASAASVKAEDSGRHSVVLEPLVSPMIQTLLVTWVRAALNVRVDISLWDQLLDTMKHLVDTWPQVVQEWGKTMETLTRALSYQVYDVDLHNLPLERQSKRSRQRLSDEGKNVEHCGGDNLDSSWHRESTQFSRGWTLKERPRSVHPLSSNLTNVLSSTNEDDENFAMLNDSFNSKQVMTADVVLVEETTPNDHRPSISSLSGADIDEKNTGNLVSDNVMSSAFDNSSLTDEEQSFDAQFFEKRSLFDRDSLTPSPVPGEDDYSTTDDAGSHHLTGGSDLTGHDEAFQIKDDGQTISQEEHADNISMQGAGSVLSGGCSQGWSPEVAVVLWRRTLGILGDVNSVKNPVTHLQIMRCVEHLIDMLLRIRDNQGIVVVTQDGSNHHAATQLRPPLVPPIHFMLPWLFTGCQLPMLYMQSKQLAVELLCKVMLHAPQDEILYHNGAANAELLLLNFYKCMHSILNSGEEKLVEVAVRCLDDYGLVVHSMPGLSLLVFDMLHACRFLIGSIAPTTNRLHAVRLLATLVIFANATVAEDCLALKSGETLSNSFEYVACAGLDAQIVRELSRVIGNGDFDIDARRAAARGLCVLLHKLTLAFALSKQNSSRATTSTTSSNSNSAYIVVISSILNDLLSKMTPDCLKLAFAICESLQIFLDDAKLLEEFCPIIPIRIVEVYCAVVAALINYYFLPHSHLVDSNRDAILTEARNLFCLLLLSLGEWVIRLSTNFLCNSASSSHSLLDSVLEVFIRCLQQLSLSAATQNLENVVVIKNCAEMILSKVLKLCGQWPLNNFGSSCSVFESSDNPVAVFGCGNDLVWTFETLSDLSSLRIDSVEACRMFCRSVSGKLAWKWARHIKSIKTTSGIKSGFHSKKESLEWIQKMLILCPHISTTLTSTGKDGRRSVAAEIDRSDWLSCILDDLSEKSYECSYMLNQQFDFMDIASSSSSTIGRSCVNDVENAIRKRNIAARTRSVTIESLPSSMFYAPNTNKMESFINSENSESEKQIIAQSSIKANRFLFSELNLLSFFRCKRELSLLNSSNQRLKADQFWRELKHLDQQTSCMETHKFAVIYVACDQEDKQSILMNERGSPRFEEFVSSLGWDIDLTTHKGYFGGLQTQGKDTAIYYSSPFLEVIYHVSTRLSSEDLTKKLRHIGNDEVWIVWSEHWRPYRRSIIPTDFADVVLSIYPLDNGLFKVGVDRKLDNTSVCSSPIDFGPLFDGALVDGSSLPILVRNTAINAGRARRSQIHGFNELFYCKTKTLNDSTNRLRQHQSYQLFLEGAYSHSVIK